MKQYGRIMAFVDAFLIVLFAWFMLLTFVVPLFAAFIVWRDTSILYQGMELFFILKIGTLVASVAALEFTFSKKGEEYATKYLK
jgi:hypothetical protein